MYGLKTKRWFKAGRIYKYYGAQVPISKLEMLAQHQQEEIPTKEKSQVEMQKWGDFQQDYRKGSCILEGQSKIARQCSTVASGQTLACSVKEILESP